MVPTTVTLMHVAQSAWPVHLETDSTALCNDFPLWPCEKKWGSRVLRLPHFSPKITFLGYSNSSEVCKTMPLDCPFEVILQQPWKTSWTQESYLWNVPILLLWPVICCSSKHNANRPEQKLLFNNWKVDLYKKKKRNERKEGGKEHQRASLWMATSITSVSGEFGERLMRHINRKQYSSRRKWATVGEWGALSPFRMGIHTLLEEYAYSTHGC